MNGRETTVITGSRSRRWPKLAGLTDRAWAVGGHHTHRGVGVSATINGSDHSVRAPELVDTGDLRDMRDLAARRM